MTFAPGPHTRCDDRQDLPQPSSWWSMWRRWALPTSRQGEPGRQPPPGDRRSTPAATQPP